MAKRTRAYISERFQNGDKPNAEEFSDLIDSAINQKSDQIFVDGDKKLGIGTETPKALLHVHDPRNIALDSGEVPTLMLGVENSLNLILDNNQISAKSNGDKASLKIQRKGGDVRFYDENDDLTTIILKDSGKMGIGNSDPQGKLHVTGADQDFVIKHTGKVGVGTTDPDGKLHVAGSEQEFVVATTGKVGVGTADPQALFHLDTTAGDTVKDDEIGALFMIGDANGKNISFDRDEIMAKNGEDVSELYLNAENGTVVVSGSLVHASDRTLKKEIKPLKKGLAEVLKLKAVSYKWKNDKKGDLKYGFIAQDVEKVLKEITYKNEKSNTKGVAYIEVVPILTNAIQEQQKQIEVLKTRLAKLEKLIPKK